MGDAGGGGGVAPLAGARLGAAQVVRYGGMLFLAAVLVQFYLAGRGVFGASGPVEGAEDLDPHRLLGTVLAALALILLVAAAVARQTQRMLPTAVVLFVLTAVEGLLAGAGSDTPSLAGGLHVVVALLIFGLGVELVSGTRTLSPRR
ncbi:MAG: hypothetical protein H0V10_04950 [Geodermatophilaceae bacterium]|nr:hypothetical protein [Geodermatophilaceae bacterium]